MIQHRVKFMIIGGYAVNFHGFPRLTHDIDLFVSVSDNNIKALEETLISFGFPESSLARPLFCKDKTILRFGLPPNRIEIFSEIPGVSWDECWSNRVGSQVDNIPLDWIGLSELRKNKRACDRGKDQIDLEELPLD